MNIGYAESVSYDSILERGLGWGMVESMDRGGGNRVYSTMMCLWTEGMERKAEFIDEGAGGIAKRDRKCIGDGC